MPESTWRNFGLVVRRALRQPFSVITLSAGLVLALGTTHGLPILIALAAVLVYSGVKLRDERFIRAAIDEDHERSLRAERRNRTFRIEELDVESRVRMKSIVKLQKEIAEDVRNSPVDEVAVGLSDTVEQTERLVDRGLAMSQKRRDLMRYLSKTDPGAIESRLRAMESRLQSEADQVRRAELESSIIARKQELDDYQAIRQASARVLDELESIENALSGLRARIVRIRSTDIDEWTTASDELRTELDSLNSAADVLDRSISEVLSIRGQQ